MALLDSSGVVAALNISFSAANCVINVGPKFGQRNPQHGWISATPFLGFLLFIHTYFNLAHGVSLTTDNSLPVLLSSWNYGDKYAKIRI